MVEKVKSKKKNKETYSITLVFDNKDCANGFVAGWLDGGLDGGGNLDWHTCYEESDDWTKDVPSMLRIKGTGNAFDEDGEIIEE